MGEITELLADYQNGNAESLEKLANIVYQQLKVIAAKQLSRRKHDMNLSPTALVNEAYVKLLRLENPSWESRRHFFSVAATAMRQVIVDYARYRYAQKRAFTQVDLSVDMFCDSDDTTVDQLLQINEALTSLSDQDPDCAKVFDCRYFAGFSTTETADILGSSQRTVERQWQKAKAFIRTRV